MTKYIVAGEGNIGFKYFKQIPVLFPFPLNRTYHKLHDHGTFYPLPLSLSYGIMEHTLSENRIARVMLCESVEKHALLSIIPCRKGG